MSAFAVLYDFSDSPVNLILLDTALERLAYRGPDGQDTLLAGSLGMGHRHFWTTPEEIGERQPLRLAGLPFTLVFDGRLDNRADLLSRLAVDSGEGASLSDAALILRAFVRWGERCVEYFIGEFALACYDERERTLFCARDHLGDRTLFYARNGNRLAVASEPWAVLGALGLAPQLDETAAALYFGRSAFADGQTFFNGVSELLPAHTLRADVSGEICLSQYWQADLEKKIRYKTDSEYSEHLLSLLEEGVRCRLRSVTPVGVQMSGGLDSTALAALAARQILPQRLVTLSQVFEELQDCDETPYIDAMQQLYNVVATKIPADRDWPYQNWDELPHHPNAPLDFPYRQMIGKIYAEARAQGLRVLFTGDFGDHLYRAERHWLADYLFDADFRAAIQEGGWHLRQQNFHPLLMFRYLRPFFTRLLGLSDLKKRLIGPPPPSVWVTPFTATQLRAYDKTSEHPYARLGSILSHANAGFASSETLYASRYGVEVRTPYRDRRLVEFFIALPAYQLYRRHTFKFITREALKGMLPDMVRTKRKALTSFLPLYRCGLEREKDWLEAAFKTRPAIWRKYIRQDRVQAIWQSPDPIAAQTAAVYPLWLCLVFETWHRRIFSSN